MLDIGTLGTAFDARQASGPVRRRSGRRRRPKFAGFYWGTRGSDFKPRLGEATSADGTAWTKVSGLGADGGALFALGNPAAFDNGGQRDPSVLYDSGTYDLYFTGLRLRWNQRRSATRRRPRTRARSSPTTRSWSARSQLLAGDGSGLRRERASAHPSVIKDGATYVMYYAGTRLERRLEDRARDVRAPPDGPFTRALPSPVLDVGAAGEFDATSVKDPVVVKVGAGDYRMLYTGVETLDGRIERVGYATSADGITWTKQRRRRSTRA